MASPAQLRSNRPAPDLFIHFGCSLVCAWWKRAQLAPEDDKITFLVYNEKGMHVEPIKLIQAHVQGLIHVPHGILSKPELMDRSYVKLLNKPILKEMTLIDTPGITANDWSGVIEEHIAILAKHATKILFLVNDMHAGVNHKAST